MKINEESAEVEETTKLSCCPPQSLLALPGPVGPPVGAGQ